MKYVTATIRVDATGWITLEVPDDWTDEEIKDFALDAYFPIEGSNVELGEAVEVVEVSATTKEKYIDACGDGTAESATKE